jgi:predicted component of type VI protein secretion system
MKFSLVITQGPHVGRLVPISLPQFVIGRDPKCHLRPASQTISKRHCELLSRDDKCFVRDLSSTNGTFVNDEQVTGERELHDGEILKVGPLAFGVRIETQAEKPTHVEKETQVPPQAAPKPVKAPAPAPAPTPAARPQVLDDDAIGSMLLEMSEEEKEAAGSDADMAGSTIMDVIKSPAEETQAESKPAPYRPASNKPATPANTASAAKAILEKYRRRPRT